MRCSGRSARRCGGRGSWKRSGFCVFFFFPQQPERLGVLPMFSHGLIFLGWGWGVGVGLRWLLEMGCGFWRKFWEVFLEPLRRKPSSCGASCKRAKLVALAGSDCLSIIRLNLTVLGCEYVACSWLLREKPRNRFDSWNSEVPRQLNLRRNNAGTSLKSWRWGKLGERSCSFFFVLVCGLLWKGRVKGSSDGWSFQQEVEASGKRTSGMKKKESKMIPSKTFQQKD